MFDICLAVHSSYNIKYAILDFTACKLNKNGALFFSFFCALVIILNNEKNKFYFCKNLYLRATFMQNKFLRS